MPEVAITIGPKTYNITCGEGEQDKIRSLGALIAEKRAELGPSAAPQESQNMLFTAFFLADELSEARRRLEDESKGTASAKAELESALNNIEHEKSKSGGKKAELRAEIATLRKSEARAREELATVKAELAQMREEAAHQHDLFGASVDADAIAASLEQLADKAEATAFAIEGSLEAPRVEDPRPKP
ncbi:MAG: cell division protein ZapA [Pseudomonadota bacterium]